MSREKNKTKIRILKATWKLLEENRGGSVRMADIAKLAGISRQALYLHYANRSELLIATTKFIDEEKNVNLRLEPSRTAQDGARRLDYYIEAWGNYIPEIYGVARALIAMQDSDEAADSAWKNRMDAMRQGCEEAVKALGDDQILNTDYSQKEATDILWTLLSVQNWEHLTLDCAWSQENYIKMTKILARRMLLSEK